MQTFREPRFLDMIKAIKGGYTLADSNITKRALAAALKELMQDMPFSKIHVSHICDNAA